MPEFRKDPIVDRWVIIAKNRSQRPHELDSAPAARPIEYCPFCEGHEEQTPNEILAYRESDSLPNGKGWRVRVVPNKFPALEVDDEFDKRRDGVFVSMTGLGAHEVIIESPQHLVSTADLPDAGLQEVLRAYRDRLNGLKQDRRLVHGMLFKNVGCAAGASLEHTHSQLIATPILPTAVKEKLSASLAHFQSHWQCIFCEMIRQELATEERIVLDMPGFVAFCPFAARFPFETWIVPKEHSSHFETISAREIADLASILKRAVAKIEAALDRPAYNYMIHTAPFDTYQLGHYHWHIEITPRLTKIAGFEWGTGCYINPAPPEETAAILRETELDFTPTQNVPIKESR